MLKQQLGPKAEQTEKWMTKPLGFFFLFLNQAPNWRNEIKPPTLKNKKVPFAGLSREATTDRPHVSANGPGAAELLKTAVKCVP